jgi:hypothetical protein
MTGRHFPLLFFNLKPRAHIALGFAFQVRNSKLVLFQSIKGILLSFVVILCLEDFNEKLN